jgi:D-cysteine desulfhydrase
MPQDLLELAVPTPVVRLALATAAGSAELWVKQDGVIHPRYGGNKTRKAAFLFAEAARRQAKRILTFGAAGSHHVLTMALFAPDFGMKVAAVLTPQPGTMYARSVLARGLEAGLYPLPGASPAEAALAFLRGYEQGDYVVPPGGSNSLGTRAYMAAVKELELQVRSGKLPQPDWIVVALGSGGTAAGILAGLACSRLSTGGARIWLCDASGRRGHRGGSKDRSRAGSDIHGQGVCGGSRGRVWATSGGEWHPARALLAHPELYDGGSGPTKGFLPA